MNVLPHLQSTSKPTQSRLCLTTPWTMILRELLMSNLFSFLFLPDSAVFALVSASLQSLCPSLAPVIFFCFLSISLTIPFLHFLCLFLIWEPHKCQCFQDVLIIFLFAFKKIHFPRKTYPLSSWQFLWRSPNPSPTLLFPKFHTSHTPCPTRHLYLGNAQILLDNSTGIFLIDLKAKLSMTKHIAFLLPPDWLNYSSWVLRWSHWTISPSIYLSNLEISNHPGLPSFILLTIPTWLIALPVYDTCKIFFQLHLSHPYWLLKKSYPHHLLPGSASLLSSLPSVLLPLNWSFMSPCKFPKMQTKWCYPLVKNCCWSQERPIKDF